MPSITVQQLLDMASSIATYYSSLTATQKAYTLVSPYLTWTQAMLEAHLPHGEYNLGVIIVDKKDFIRFIMKVQQEIALLP